MFSKHIFLGLVLFAVSLSCKTRQSDLASISASELDECPNRFYGKRLMLIVSPEVEFDRDADLAKQVFVKSMSETNLTQYSYFEDRSSPSKRQACINYVQTQQAKYELFDHLHANKATKANFRNSIINLGREIKRLRAEASSDSNPEKFEIQVILAISSHGLAFDEYNPSGGIVLAPAQNFDPTSSVGPSPISNPNVSSTDHADIMEYTEFIDLIRQNLLTRCVESSCSQLEYGTIPMANELILLTDNCFSGKLNSTLEASLGHHPAYKLKSVTDSNSKVTKIFSLSSSNGLQVSVASFAKGGYGTLYQSLSEMIRYWRGDRDNNNAISLREVSDYVVDELKPRYANDTLENLKEQVLPTVVCASDKTKYISLMSDRRLQMDRLFQDPIRSLRSGTIAGMMIQQPTFYSNMSDELLTSQMLAVGGRSSQSITQQEATPPGMEAVEDEIKMHIAVLNKFKTYVAQNLEDKEAIISPNKLGLTNEEQITYIQITQKCSEFRALEQQSIVPQLQPNELEVPPLNELEDFDIPEFDEQVEGEHSPNEG